MQPANDGFLPGVALRKLIDQEAPTRAQNTSNFVQGLHFIAWLAEFVDMFKNPTADDDIEVFLCEGQIGWVRRVNNIQFMAEGNIRQGGFVQLTNIKSGNLKSSPPEQISQLPIAASPIKHMSGRYLPGDIIRYSYIVPDPNGLVQVYEVRES